MEKYFEKDNIVIRSMKESDAEEFIKVYRSYGWNNPIETYNEYYREQQNGLRKVYVAEVNNKVAGHCTLILNTLHGPWANLNQPEVADLRVFDAYQNRGIGDLFLEIIEKEVSKLNDKIIIGVGLHGGYGPAQRLYVKRGYIPDGSGIWYNNKNLAPHAECINDDSLVLYLSKKLR